MASNASATDELPYTINGVLDRVGRVVSSAEEVTGFSFSLALFLNTIFVCSLLSTLYSYLLMRMTKAGFENELFSRKLYRALWNWMTRKDFCALPRDVVSYVKAHAEANNPDLAMAAADQFGVHHPLMHVGETKGKVLDDIVTKADPDIVLELGAYFGYSAVRIGRLLKKTNAKLISIEFNPSYADAARDFVEFCGLEDRVQIVTGSAAEKIPHLKDEFGLDQVDLVLIDHWKDFYVSDLKVLEKTGLLKKGAVVVADNIVLPGAPEYAEYVRSSPKYQSRCYPTRMPEIQANMVDAIEVSIYQGLRK